MLNNLKNSYNSLLEKAQDKELIDEIKKLGDDIVSLEDNINSREKEFNELKNDYIKAVKSNSFKVTADDGKDNLTLEDIGKKVIERRKEK